LGVVAAVVVAADNQNCKVVVLDDNNQDIAKFVNCKKFDMASSDKLIDYRFHYSYTSVLMNMEELLQETPHWMVRLT
jgi:hypothetical protein